MFAKKPTPRVPPQGDYAMDSRGQHSRQEVLFDDTFRSNELVVNFTLNNLRFRPGQWCSNQT